MHALDVSQPWGCAGALACLPVMGPLYMAWAGLQVAAGVANLLGTGLTVRRQLALACNVCKKPCFRTNCMAVFLQ